MSDLADRPPGRPSAPPTVVVSCRLPLPVYDALCAAAVKEGVSVNLVIVRALQTADLHHLVVFP